MTDIVIKAENIGKKYIIGHQAERGDYTLLRDVLMQNARTLWNKTKDLAKGKPIIQGDTMEEVWALKDVCFEIRRGEAVGIIGRNGAGKSTLLKILSRITEPTTGRVSINGHIASLLEVGTGFHPELSGRENIYLNGTILGMTRMEIKKKFDEIVAFAEVEKYLDTPVKRYSSGMYVRLAFAVAAHLEPEILVVDEVLAVGDAQFQKKCLGKMGDVAREGRTVLFVSHNMAAVQQLCGRAKLIEKGEIVFTGTSEAVVSKYLQSAMSTAEIPLSERIDRGGDGKVRIVSLSITSTSGSELIRCSDGLQIRIGYTSDDSVRNPSFLIGVFDNLSRRIFFMDSRDAGGVPEAIPASGVAVCTTGAINITPGMFHLNIAMLAADSVADHIVGAHFFEVTPDDFFRTGRLTSGQLAICLLRQQWQIEKI